MSVTTRGSYLDPGHLAKGRATTVPTGARGALLPTVLCLLHLIMQLNTAYFPSGQ